MVNQCVLEAIGCCCEKRGRGPRKQNLKAGTTTVSELHDHQPSRWSFRFFEGDADLLTRLYEVAQSGRNGITQLARWFVVAAHAAEIRRT